MPAPSFVREPVVVPMMPVMAVLPAPPTVRSIVAPVMPPDRVRVPASELIRESAPKTNAPVRVLVPETFSSAPAFETPVPLRFKPSPTPVRPPCTWRVAPDATVVVPASVPSAVLFWILRTPPLMVVPPV